MEQKQRFYVGTYTEPILFGTGEVLQGKGEGIYILELDRNEKTLEVSGVVKNVKNPSFLTVSRDGSYVFAVNELKQYGEEEGGSVSSFHVADEAGNLKLCDRKPTHGQDPCHVALSEDERFIVVSNFMTGSICVYEIGRSGNLTETDYVEHHGCSIHPIRQKGPHAHSCITVKGTDRIAIPDLGMDQLVVYQLTENGKAVSCEAETYACSPGSGPRFGEFHPRLPVLYLIEELASAVSVLKYERETGRFTCIQEISTLEKSCENICADLHITGDGRFLYASNRGHDSITVFGVNPADGTLKKCFNIPSGGKTPRNFALDHSGHFLLVGNQDSDCVVVYERSGETGALIEVSRIDIPTPVCICPAN